MEANDSKPPARRDGKPLARALAAALVRNFAAVDDLLQAQYAESLWETPDRVSDRLEGRLAARLLDMVTAHGSDTIGELVAGLAQSAEKLDQSEHLDPWDVLAFRAPVDFRSHRVVLTDPPALSPDVRAVQARLLRRGVAILGEHAEGGRRALEVSSYDPGWAQGAVREVLPWVEVDWLGKTAREIKPGPCAGWREKGDDVIRAWISLEAGEHIDEVVAAEDETQIAVLAFVCAPAAGSDGRPRHEPVNIHLERPIGNRVVVDGFSDQVVPHE